MWSQAHLYHNHHERDNALLNLPSFVEYLLDHVKDGRSHDQVALTPSSIRVDPIKTELECFVLTYSLITIAFFQGLYKK